MKMIFSHGVTVNTIQKISFKILNFKCKYCWVLLLLLRNEIGLGMSRQEKEARQDCLYSRVWRRSVILWGKNILPLLHCTFLKKFWYKTYKLFLSNQTYFLHCLFIPFPLFFFF